MSPLIGISIYAPNAEGRFHLPTEYVAAVRRAGGIPLLMPPGEPRLEEWVAALDGMVLTGGGDLAPDTYGGETHPLVYDVSTERDFDEIAVAGELATSNLPGLCICRGMQILNVALGGTLMAHLPDVVGDAIPHRREDRGPLRHAVKVDPGSRLARHLGGETELNPHSWHHQAVANLADELRVVARAPDGIIEAVEMTRRPNLIAVQWHPELLAAEDPTQQGLFDAMVEMAREYRQRKVTS